MRETGTRGIWVWGVTSREARAPGGLRVRRAGSLRTGLSLCGAARSSGEVGLGGVICASELSILPNLQCSTVQ
eukprot:4966376-Prymnesium_polylepis.1